MEKSYIQELREAKRALSRSRNITADIQQAVGSARSWGLLDLLGGGFVSSLAKRSRIEKLNEQLSWLEHSLDVLQNELEDVRLYAPAALNDSFSRQMLDVIFDNIFTDYAVQSELVQLKNQLDDLEDDLEQLERKLDKMIHEEECGS